MNAEKDVCCIASTQTNAERLMNTAPTLSRDKDRTIVGYNSFETQTRMEVVSGKMPRSR